MRPTRTARLAATALAATLLAACSSGDATEDPTPTDTATSETATETPTPDETTSSATSSPTETEGMTVEQAQDIVDATTAVYNEATIRLLEQQRIDTEWYDQMRSIYVDEMVDVFEQLWVSEASNDFEGYETEDPTGITDTVLSVDVDAGDCFMVNVERDYSGITSEDAANPVGVNDDIYLAFIRATDTDRDGAGTGWLRKWDVSPRSGDPGDLCERDHGETSQ